MKWHVHRIGSTALAAVLAVGIGSAAAESQVADAARARDRAAVAALIKAQADVNAPQPDGATALHWAAHWNDVEMARLLIDAKADVSATNDYGVTPLSLACGDAGVEMVELLLAAGADPNRALRSGETPLMTATRAGDLAIVEALLARGVDVNVQEQSHGQTALMWAFSRDHLDIARALMDRGAYVNAASDAGFTPLLFATRQGNLDAVRLLQSRGAYVHATASDGVNALHVAVVRGHIELAEHLLAGGVDPNAAGPGYTALHWAAGRWDSVTTHEYFETPPQPAGWPDEWRLLIGLHGEPKFRIIKSLLAYGADPNVRTTKPPPRFGYSFQAFVRAGGSLLGASPFLLAASVGDVPVMRLLLAAGAIPAMTTNDLSTAAMLAAGMTSIEEEMTTLEPDRVAAVGLALDLGVDKDAANELGNTALHASALLGFPEVARLLVERGAAVNPVNGSDETPLRMAEGTIINAMFFIHENVAKVLRELGGTSDGSGICTPGILERASVNSRSTVCEDAGTRPTPTAPPVEPPNQ
ncbi:MAG: hypothetical protein FJW23_08305 [Acidimicrobiia bacterium]|nr:hypothetical protein [Acidimicrobiia bacterium]